MRIWSEPEGEEHDEEPGRRRKGMGRGSYKTYTKTIIIVNRNKMFFFFNKSDN